LISTSSLEVVNVIEQLIVDGVLVDIKIVEEWGFTLGEDACLVEEDDMSVSVTQEIAANYDDLGVNTDCLTAKLAKEVEEDILYGAGLGIEKEHEGSTPNDVAMKSVGRLECTNSITHVASNCDGVDKNELIAAPHVPLTAQDVLVDKGTITHDSSNYNSVDMNETCAATQVPLLAQVVLVDKLKVSASKKSLLAVGDGLGAVSKRVMRVQPGIVEEAHSLQSGPWSVEWLRNVKRGDIGLISSKHKRLKRTVKGGAGLGIGNDVKACKKKAGGVFRHPVLTLKKVARLPSKDRAEVLKVLKDSKAMRVLKKKIHNRHRRRERVTKSLEEVHQISSYDSSIAASCNTPFSQHKNFLK